MATLQVAGRSAPATVESLAATPDSRSGSSGVLALACFALVSIVWGTTYLAIAWSIETIPPFLMAGMRFVVAGALLYVPARWLGAAAPTRAGWGMAARSGVLLFLGGNGLVVWAEQHVASGLAAVLVATMPLWMVLEDYFLFGARRPGLRVGAGLALGLAGVVMLSAAGGEGGGAIHAGGALALLVACASWSLGSLFARRSQPEGSAFLVAAMQMLAGGAALLLIAALLGEVSRFELAQVSMRSLLGFGWLVLLGSIAAMSAYTYLVRVWPAARVATYAYLNPVVALLVGTVVAGEPFGPGAALGAVVILAGVLVVNSRSR